MRRPATFRLACGLAVLAVGCGGGGGGEGAGDRGTERADPAPTEVKRAAPPRAAPRAASTWSRDAVLRRLDGRRVRAAGRTVRLDATTMTCRGLGAARSGRAGERAWSRFRCVQPTFPAGQVAGPDLVFTVRATGRRTFEVLERHFTRY